MPNFFSYVPATGLKGNNVTLLKSAPTEAELRANRTYDPDQSGSINATQVTDTGIRDQVTNSKTGAVLTAAVCQVTA